MHHEPNDLPESQNHDGQLSTPHGPVARSTAMTAHEAVEARQFHHDRLVAAFRTGTWTAITTESRHPNTPVLAGVAVAILSLVAVAVLAYIAG